MISREESVLKRKRIKKFGKYSTIRTIIKEEPIKLGQYLRGEKKSYKPVSILRSALNE